MLISGSLHSFPGLVVIIEGNVVVSDVLLLLTFCCIPATVVLFFFGFITTNTSFFFASLHSDPPLHRDHPESIPRLTRGCLIVATSALYARIPCSV